MKTYMHVTGKGKITLDTNVNPPTKKRLAPKKIFYLTVGKTRISFGHYDCGRWRNFVPPLFITDVEAWRTAKANFDSAFNARRWILVSYSSSPTTPTVEAIYKLLNQ